MPRRLRHSLGQLNARMRPASAERIAYLHLGMNKAGSTSLQTCFHRYVDRRVSYLDLPQSNHSRAVTLRFEDPPPPRAVLSTDPAARANETAQVRAEFDAAVARAPGSVIVSAETFSVFPDVATCQGAVDYFRDRFDDVVGVIYVRDPGGSMASGFQEGLKWGRAAPGLGTNYPKYRSRLERWVDVLPQENLHIVLLHPAALTGGDLVTDFATRLGIELSGLRRRTPRRVNTSLSAQGIAALLRYRQAHGPVGPSEAARKANTRLLAALRRLGTDRFAIHPDTLAPVLRQNADDLAWVEQKMGRAFPSAPAQHGTQVFRSLDDVAEFGATLGDDLRAWQARVFPFAAPLDGPPEDVLAGIDARFQARAAN